MFLLQSGSDFVRVKWIWIMPFIPRLTPMLRGDLVVRTCTVPVPVVMGIMTPMRRAGSVSLLDTVGMGTMMTSAVLWLLIMCALQPSFSQLLVPQLCCQEQSKLNYARFVAAEEENGTLR